MYAVLPGSGLPGADGEASSTERAYHTVRHRLLDGAYVPGAPLPETELARACGVSRTPIREVLARLHHEGYLERLPGRGYFVARVTVQLINDGFSVRRLLEGAAAAQAAATASGRDVGRLRALARSAFDVDDAASYRRAQTANTEFHLAVAAASRNRLALDLIRRCLAQMERLGAAGVHPAGLQHRATAEHQAIVDAIERGDADAARTAMEEHLDHSARLLKEALMSGALPPVGIA